MSRAAVCCWVSGVRVDAESVPGSVASRSGWLSLLAAIGLPFSSKMIWPSVAGGAPVVAAGGTPIPNLRWDRLPEPDRPLPAGQRRPCRSSPAFQRAALVGRARLAAFQVLEAEFVVLLELADLFLHLQELEAHLLDTPVERADLFLELPDASNVAGLHV